MDSTKQAIRQILADSDSKVISEKEFLLRFYNEFAYTVYNQYEEALYDESFDYASYIITNIINSDKSDETDEE